MKQLSSSPRLSDTAIESETLRELRVMPKSGTVSRFGLTQHRLVRSTRIIVNPSYAPGQTTSPLPRKDDAFFRQAGHGLPVGGSWKRGLDFSIAVAALIIMAPIMITIALLILVTMGRPIFFVQQRVGFNKRGFRCYKFRTMVTDAQKRLARLLAEDPEAARHWRETQKLRNDPRITWLGHILRKSSLDELPQLFNILRGEMSCVGPRPVLDSELQRYGSFAAAYASAKPGLTGIWQVSGRSNTTYAHRVKCDLFYVRRWSMLLDIAIMVRTVPAVMRTRDTA
jgi:exopolysaccharide production protein ExoY